MGETRSIGRAVCSGHVNPRASLRRVQEDMEMDRKTDGEPVNVSTPAAHGVEPEVPLWRGLALGVAVAVGVSASIVIFGRPHAALSPAAHAPAAAEEAYEAD